MKAIYKESGGDSITLRIDDHIMERHEQPERVTGVECLVEGRAWTLRFSTKSIGTAWDRALLPASAQHVEGGPDKFAHYKAEDGGALRIRCFLQVQRIGDGAIAMVPRADGATSKTPKTWRLPTTNLARLEHPSHAAQRIARDWFAAPMPRPRFHQVLSLAGKGDAADSWVLAIVYRTLLADSHPTAKLETLAWVRAGEEPPGDAFADQLNVMRRLAR